MGLMKKLTSALVASSLVLGVVGTASAATQDDINSAVKRMQSLNLVKGRDGGDLALNSPITRAELVTIIVRAYGQETNAQYMKGATAFSDTANHWASGYIWMAKRIMQENGVTELGYPDGSFKPDANVTNAEAVAFLMKAIGAQPDNTLAWPDNYLQGALNAGFITTEDLATLEAIKNEPASRGLVFYLADSAFSGYKLANGSTIYQTFVDSVAPVVTLGEIPQTTLEPKVTVTGTATGAEAVYVNGQPAALANGSFTADVDLALGENTITVTAVDLVGNTAEQTLKVTRTTGTATGIEASDITVAAGETIDVAAAVVDAYGNKLDAEITGESNVGTFADGKFTASTKAGEGTLTLKSGDLTKTVKVTVTAGKLAKVEGEKVSAAPGEALKLVGKDQYGNTVEGVTFSEDSADAVIDGDTFIATKAGKYTVKGVKDDVTVESTIGVYGEAEKLVVTAPEKVVGNGETEYEFKVAAVDKNGIVVGDYDGVIELYDSDLEADDYEVEAENGIAVFKLKASSTIAGGTAEVNFRDVDNNDIEGSIEVEVEEQVATSIELDAPKYLPTNTTDDEVEIDIIVKDQAGEDMLEGGWDFDIKVSGPAELENGKQSMSEYFTTDANTFYVYPSDAAEAGDVTVTVSSEGLGSATVTLKAAYAKEKSAISLKVSETKREVGAKDSLTSDNWFEFTVKLTDKNGVPVTTENDIVKVKFEDVADEGRVWFSTDKSTWTELSDDNLNLSLTTDKGEAKFWVAGNIADTFKVSVYDPEGVLKSSSTQEVTLEADDPAVVAFEHGTRLFQKAKTVTGEISAQVYDRFGNKVAVPGVKVTFTSDDWDGLKLNGKKEDVSVRTDANGRATVKVEITASKYDGASISVKEATYSGETLATFTSAPSEFELDDLSDTVALNLSDEIPESITASFVDLNGGRITSYKLVDEDNDGNVDGFKMKIVVKDDLGVGITGLEDEFEFEASDSDVEDALENASVEAGTEAGEYFVTLKPESAGTLTVTAKLPSYGDVKVSKSITVKAGKAYGVEVAEASDYDGYDGKIVVDENKLTAITIRLVDQWDNPASSNSDEVTIDVTADASGATLINDKSSKKPFLDVRDADGNPVDSITLKAGRTSTKIYVLTNAQNATLTLNARDGISDTYNLIVNPAE